MTYTLEQPNYDISVRVTDGLTNFVHGGMGHTGFDKGMQSTFLSQRRSRAELTAAYRHDFLAQQVIDVPANDATRAWRQWRGEPKINQAIEKEERRLRVRDHVNAAYKRARLHGGSAIIIHDGTMQAQMQEPLEIESIKRGGLKALVVATVQEITPLDASSYVQDPADPHYGLPELWQYTPARFGTGAQFVIHHSRLVIFQGRDRPFTDQINFGDWWWGDSELEACFQAIANAGAIRGGAAHLAEEANIDVLKVQGLNEKLATPAGENEVARYTGLIRQMKGIYRLAVLDGNDEIERNAYHFAGLNDLMNTTHALVASAADIPITRLLGQSPGGMNATGEHDMLNYYHSLSGIQESNLQPPMMMLDRAVQLSANGNVDEELTYDWQLPDMMTSKEKADISKIRAETINAYAVGGSVPSHVIETLAEQSISQGGGLPGGEAAYKEYREDGEPEDPIEDDLLDPKLPEPDA